MNLIKSIKSLFPGVAELIVAVGQLGLGVYQITEGNVEVGYALIASAVATIVGAMRK